MPDCGCFAAKRSRFVSGESRELEWQAAGGGISFMTHDAMVTSRSSRKGYHMRNILAGALGALAITATLSGTASAAQRNSKPEPAMTTTYSEQADASAMIDHVNGSRVGAGSGAVVVGNVEHGPTVAGEQRDQNMYDAN